MATRNEKKYWRIQGWDGSSLLFERKVLFGQITECSMKNLLRTMVAKLSLDEDEIISSYAKKRTKIYFNHLEVNRNRGGPYGFTCGNNPYVTAVIEKEL